MPFNYEKMRKTAKKLLSKQVFGGKFILQHPEGSTYDPIKKKNVSTYKEYTGDCVMKIYEDDGLGKLGDIVQAGDLTFVCNMDDQNVIPTKNSDKIIFEGVTYNIIEVSTVNPNGKKILVHKCYARKASK